MVSYLFFGIIYYEKTPLFHRDWSHGSRPNRYTFQSIRWNAILFFRFYFSGFHHMIKSVFVEFAEEIAQLGGMTEDQLAGVKIDLQKIAVSRKKEIKRLWPNRHQKDFRRRIRDQIDMIHQEEQICKS